MNKFGEGNVVHGTGRPRGVTTLYVIGIGRLAPLATTKAEPLGLEMDANPVTKGAAGPREGLQRVSKTFGIQRWAGTQSGKRVRIREV